MTDASWDNGGGAPEKKKLGLGLKVLIGCGGFLLLAMVTCTVGGVVLGRMAEKDPEAFGKRMEAWGKGLVQKDWDRLKGLVDQLQTDEGTLAVYRSQGELKETYATEAAFLEVVRGWRPRMPPLSAEVPLDMGRRGKKRAPEAGRATDLQVNKGPQGTTIRYRYAGGARLSATFDGNRLMRLQVD